MDNMEHRPILPLPVGVNIAKNINILQIALSNVTSNQDDILMMTNPISVGRLLSYKAIFVLNQHFWFSKVNMTADDKKLSTRLAITRNLNGFFGIHNNKLYVFYPDDAATITLLGDVSNMMI